jgi:hypothetical protein
MGGSRHGASAAQTCDLMSVDGAGAGARGAATAGTIPALSAVPPPAAAPAAADTVSGWDRDEEEASAPIPPANSRTRAAVSNGHHRRGSAQHIVFAEGTLFLGLFHENC